MRVIYHPEVEKKIRALFLKDKARILKIIDLFLDYQFGLTSAYLKKITEKLWELKAGRYRLLFSSAAKKILVLIIFTKKTQKTPPRFINLAKRRLREYE